MTDVAVQGRTIEHHRAARVRVNLGVDMEREGGHVTTAGADKPAAPTPACLTEALEVTLIPAACAARQR